MAIETKRYTYIDVLKAFAIIAIVLYHLKLLPFGFLGVDIFLVIAGFFTTKSLTELLNASEVSFCRGYITFITKRLFRLMPVLLTACSVVMLLGWFTMLPDDYENLSESAIATNIYGNNILSSITSKDYWDIANDYKPLMHTWYVGLLMQCYLVYPLFYWGRKSDDRNKDNITLTLISILTVSSLLFYFGTSNDPFRFYHLPCRFFEFALGGIIAFLYKPDDKSPLPAAFAYFCYALLLILLIVSFPWLPNRIRLVSVVALTCVLMLSGSHLSKGLAANQLLAKIGSASFSIYVWHQVIIAFYRYILGSPSTWWSYLTLCLSICAVSWLSYAFIEKKVLRAYRSETKRRVTCAALLVAFALVSVYAGHIYLNAGVVRDVPELGIFVGERHRKMHAEYCDRAYKYNNPFYEHDKHHWLVVGDSFGRDFVNVILESDLSSNIEVSYLPDYSSQSFTDRVKSADRVFIAVWGLSEQLVKMIEIQCYNSISTDKLVIVGEKNFGESNGHVYAKRFCSNYFEQWVEVENQERYLRRNKIFLDLYGERFLDMMSLVTNSDGRVRVFTPEHLFISADTRHLTQGGARFFSKMIDWDKYLND